MGAKTWMLIYSDGGIPEKLKNNPFLDREASDKLVHDLFPKDKLQHIDGGDLSYTCPPNKEIYADCFNGFSILAAKEFGGPCSERSACTVGILSCYLLNRYAILWAFVNW
jgi:hypothetical protein